MLLRMLHTHRRWRKWIPAVGACLLLWLLLPYDNTVVLLARWHLHRLSGTLGGLLEPRNPLAWEPRFTSPWDMSDVAIIIKTGYTTQDRLVARLDAFGDADDVSNVILVGDYATRPGEHFTCNGQQMPVYDVLAGMAADDALISGRSSLRLHRYLNLTSAIARGETDLARNISISHGWEMDIMKHISGLEYAFRAKPGKKWYIMLDDDTYLLNHSLQAILRHLDPSVPHYLGNAVGDYKGRFAHAGSALGLSQTAMHQLFVEHPEMVARAHWESLSASWGDKLIATTFMRLGIYLDETHKVSFNGDPPQWTRIQEDRRCAPIVSFHKLSPLQMLDVSRTFEHTTKSVRWVDLWNIYQAQSLDASRSHAVRSHWDHVGPLDDSVKAVNNIRTARSCRETCIHNTSSCLAWTWEAETRTCTLSPWMVVGAAVDRKYSGINTPRAQSLLGACQL